jgi:exodeoxyribonuclease VIII
MQLGTAIHARILEPDKYQQDYFVLPQFSDKLKGKFDRDDYLKANAHRTRLDPGTANLIEEISNAIEKKPFINRILTHSDKEVEVSVFWTDPETGIKFKVRLDLVLASLGLIVDLKTTTSCDKWHFKRQCQKLHYDLSAYMYRHIAEQVMGRRFEFSFLAIGKSHPLDSVIFKPPEEMFMDGKRKFDLFRTRILDCINSNQWPGADNGSGYVDLPW